MRLTEIVTPLKPLEAMAQGRMFVASDVGGHRELVRDGETGFLFAAGDAPALARAIQGVLAAPRRMAPAVGGTGQAIRRDRALGVEAQREPLRQRLPTAAGAASGRWRGTHAPRALVTSVCGIYGMLHLGGASGAVERAASDGAPHRASRPGRRGRHTPTARWRIGMRRLSIIDVGGGHQPLTNEDGTLWLVANGEIYNYPGAARRADRAGPRLQEPVPTAKPSFSTCTNNTVNHSSSA